MPKFKRDTTSYQPFIIGRDSSKRNGKQTGGKYKVTKGNGKGKAQCQEKSKYMSMVKGHHKEKKKEGAKRGRINWKREVG